MWWGDVRWATFPSVPPGSCQGGSQWSRSPTKVSKNCQVRRAIWPKLAAFRLGQRGFGDRPRQTDPVGDQGARTARRSTPQSWPQRRRMHQADHHRQEPPPCRRGPHVRDEVEQAGSEPAFGRGRVLPLQHVPAGDEVADERPPWSHRPRAGPGWPETRSRAGPGRRTRTLSRHRSSRRATRPSAPS